MRRLAPFLKENDSNQSSDSTAATLYEWVESFVLTVVIVVLVFAFIARTAVVKGGSMEDTLADGDMLVVSRLLYTPARGDIIVATKPIIVNEPLIKRIIATGGQSVDIDFVNGKVWVDGQKLDEPYAKTMTNREFDISFPVTVPKGQLFVMGDNRNASLDSRAQSIGFIDERYVLGKAVWRILPLGRFGAITGHNNGGG